MILKTVFFMLAATVANAFEPATPTSTESASQFETQAPRCSDSKIQKIFLEIRNLIPLSPVNEHASIPAKIYEFMHTLSVSSFNQIISDIKPDKFMIGPSTDGLIINFNPEFIKYVEDNSQFPEKYLQFVLAHELAHQVQRYHHRKNPKESIMGYNSSSFRSSVEYSVYLHGETDCVALSLMKNAKMTVNADEALEFQLNLQRECLDAERKSYCNSAFDIRLKHMKQWLENQQYNILIPL